MNIFQSRQEIRWWFWSRTSGRLNSLSYWLCILFLSAALSLVINALWRVHDERQTWLENAAKFSDWIYSESPKGLEAYKEPFEKQRKYLINRVGYKGDNQPLAKAPLINASDIKRIPNLQVGAVLGKVDIPVYPTCATFSKRDGKITAEEDFILHNFAALVATELYKGSDHNHIERSLAASLGLTDSTTDTSIFDVPWIYVASDKGAVAVFPGTDVIAPDKWDARSRPWFKAAFQGETFLASKGPLEDGQLTVTYLDVLSRSPMLVRTYMHKFKLTKQEFVICIDLKLRDEDVSGATPSFFATKPDYTKVFVAALASERVHLAHYVIFGLATLSFLTLRWISAARESRIIFERTNSILGLIGVDAKLKMQKDEQSAKELKYGVKVGSYLPVELSDIKTKSSGETVSKIAGKSRSNLRGFELWEVNRKIGMTWSLLGVGFESEKITYIGTIGLTYSNDVLPEANWSLFNNRAFSKSEEDNLRGKLPDILQENADLCGATLDIPFQTAEFPAFLYPPDIPDLVKTAVEAKELSAARHSRAYIRLSNEKIEDLYSKSDVKAVMNSGYFEQLLNHGQTDFLEKGKTIYRVISFPNRDAKLNLTEEGQKYFKKLLDFYSSASSRRLSRMDEPIKNEVGLLPIYDFAILNDSFVVVAHFISQAIGIDNASGKQTKSDHYIQGYMSWRKADIEFYRELFEEMAKGLDKNLLQNN